MFLENKREEINNIDANIIELIIKRRYLSDEIIRFKQLNNLNIYDRDREKFIIESLKREYSSRLDPIEIEKLFTEILFFSKQDHLKNFSSRELFNLFKAKPLLIAGPCTIESEEQIFKIAEDLAGFGIKYLRGGAFKPRTSPYSFQGLGNEGLSYMKKAANKFEMKVVSEITSIQQLIELNDLLDIIQIGSKNMFAYQLLKDIGKFNSKENKPIILKRNFNATLNEFLHAADYLRNEGSTNIILCLRGIRTFEQIDSQLRFTPDLASISELKKMTELPVIFDPSHATGDSKYIFDITKGALALGADGIMIETHYSPEDALVDSNQTIDYTTLKKIFSFIEQIRYAL